MKEIYLDNAATTPIEPCAQEKIVQMMCGNFGNPSSMHTKGLAANRAMEEARASVAACMQVDKNRVFFTGSGTESNNLAVLGIRPKGKIVTTKTEHKSVLESAKNSGRELVFANDLSHLETLVDSKTALVSIAHVNNETGSIAPISDIYSLVKEKSNAVFHVDNVQGFRKLPAVDADLISVSAHKIGGPKGVGAIFIKNGVKINPIIFGGGQEKGMRSGTENTLGIAGFGAAASHENHGHSVPALNKRMREILKDAHFNSPKDASPFILNVGFEGVMAETLMHCLEMQGIYVGTGAACSSNRPQLSETLLAIGTPRELIKGSIRISFSPQNTMEEVEIAGEAIVKEVANLRRLKR